MSIIIASSLHHHCIIIASSLHHHCIIISSSLHHHYPVCDTGGVRLPAVYFTKSKHMSAALQHSSQAGHTLPFPLPWPLLGCFALIRYHSLWRCCVLIRYHSFPLTCLIKLFQLFESLSLKLTPQRDHRERKQIHWESLQAGI